MFITHPWYWTEYRTVVLQVSCRGSHRSMCLMFTEFMKTWLGAGREQISAGTARLFYVTTNRWKEYHLWVSGCRLTSGNRGSCISGHKELLLKWSINVFLNNMLNVLIQGWKNWFCGHFESIWKMLKPLSVIILQPSGLFRTFFRVYYNFGWTTLQREGGLTVKAVWNKCVC